MSHGHLSSLVSEIDHPSYTVICWHCVIYSTVIFTACVVLLMQRIKRAILQSYSVTGSKKEQQALLTESDRADIKGTLFYYKTEIPSMWSVAK